MQFSEAQHLSLSMTVMRTNMPAATLYRGKQISIISMHIKIKGAKAVAECMIPNQDLNQTLRCAIYGQCIY